MKDWKEEIERIMRMDRYDAIRHRVGVYYYKDKLEEVVALVQQELSKAREELFTKEESRVIRFAFRNMEEQINTVWDEDTYKELERKLETILN